MVGLVAVDGIVAEPVLAEVQAHIVAPAEVVWLAADGTAGVGLVAEQLVIAVRGLRPAAKAEQVAVVLWDGPSVVDAT